MSDSSDSVISSSQNYLQTLKTQMSDSKKIQETVDASTYGAIPNAVKQFNTVFGKPVPTTPVIADPKRAQFCYDFIQEEATELKEAYENGDIVEVLDAACDLAYVAVGDVLCAFGIVDKFPAAFREVHASNLSKLCKTQEEAEETIKVRSVKEGPCHWEMIGDNYVVYRSRDRKVMKSINYFRPNLAQFFTAEELAAVKAAFEQNKQHA